MATPILMIDDDDKLIRLVARYLSDFGYAVMAAVHPRKGLEWMRRNSPALIILDVMMPDMDGFEICKAIRRESDVPIIMLTARGEVTDRVVGLELGADDYLAKPFDPRELAARIQSILRRRAAGGRPAGNEGTRVFGNLTVHFGARRALLNGEDVRLTTNEFAALVLLVEGHGRVLNRDQILNALRGIDCDAYNRTVDITMSRLRQKLGDDPRNPTYIKTIWGEGYMFIAQ